MNEDARTELTMIDRGAMAIASSIDDGRYYNSISFQNAARAALRAMREPTDAMLVAGLVAGSNCNKPFADSLDDPKAFAASIVSTGDGRLYRTSYAAMIEAPLTT